MPRGGVRGHHNYPKGRASKGKAVVAPLAPAMNPMVAPAPKPTKSKGVGRGHGAHHHGAVPKAHHSHPGAHHPRPGAHHPHKKKVK